MYFRFGSALMLVLLISVAGIAIEKRCLALRRASSRQHYRNEQLRDVHARIRVRTQQLGAPERLIEAIESGKLQLTVPEAPPSDKPRFQLAASQRT